jgi:hypothetical protein
LVGQSLAACAEDGEVGALDVVHPQLDPVGVAEVELGQVAMQVGFADVKIHAVNPALENGEIPFGGVGVPIVSE